MFEAETMSEVRKKAMGLQRRRWPSIAPRFFVASDSVICALAFAHARQGRSKVIQEVLWRIHLSFQLKVESCYVCVILSTRKRSLTNAQDPT